MRMPRPRKETMMILETSQNDMSVMCGMSRTNNSKTVCLFRKWYISRLNLGYSLNSCRMWWSSFPTTFSSDQVLNQMLHLFNATSSFQALKQISYNLLQTHIPNQLESHFIAIIFTFNHSLSYLLQLNVFRYPKLLRVQIASRRRSSSCFWSNEYIKT